MRSDRPPIPGLAGQQCPECGSPLKPCKCDRDRGRATPGSTLRTKSKFRVLSFSKKYDGTGPRYGPLFRTVRDLTCWLRREGYQGPGHYPSCGRGVQDSPHATLEQGWGRTAHHVGRLDEEGLIPCCGKAHDILAGLGSRTTQQRFRAWLDERGFTLRQVGLLYVAQAKEPRL